MIKIFSIKIGSSRLSQVTNMLRMKNRSRQNMHKNKKEMMNEKKFK